MAGVTRKIFMAAAAACLGTSALAVPASANHGCGQVTGHHTTTSTLPPLSSYFDHEAKLKTQSVHCRQSASTVTQSHSSLPPLSSAFTTTRTVKVHSPAPRVTYTQPSYTPTVSYAPLSTSVISGLGHNESLRPTSCPVAVHNPEGGRVLGCYNVVRRVAKPVTRTTYYQVVRPIIYVRYPVPVPVCRVPTCRTHHHHYHGGSRYGW